VSLPFLLSRQAEADLRSIVRYSREQWGEAQARTYLQAIKQAATRLAQGEGRYQDMGELYPGLRMVRCQHHYIFCLPRTGQPALIVAILHKRMDMMARLGSRL